MKKLYIIFVFIFILISVCFGQSITINSIGMHGEEGNGDFDITQNEEISLIVNYTVSGLRRREQVQGYSFDDEFGQIALSFYNDNDSVPVDDNWCGELFYPVEINTNSTAGTFDIISTIQLSTFPLNSSSIQANLSLYTNQEYTSSMYSSYVADTYYPTILPLSEPISGYSKYLIIDTVTTPPILYNPTSPTVSTYDNSSLLIDFQLSEAPLAGSAKVYFSTSPDGSTPNTTLTLANSYHNTTRHQVTFDASALTTASPHIAAVSGSSTSLIHLNTYYVAIGYQDASGSPETLSSWNKLVYDNQVDFPENLWSPNYYSQNENDITLTFNLSEPTIGDVILTIIPHSPDGDNRIIIFRGYSFASGQNNLTIKGENLPASTNYIASTSGYDYLSSGVKYSYSLGVNDLAGNDSTSTQSSPIEYFWDSNIQIETLFSEINPNSSFNSALSDSYQNLACLTVKTESGESRLNSITFEVNSGSMDSDNISRIKIANGSGPLKFLDYTGPGSYTFSNMDFDLTDNLWSCLDISFLIDYPDNGFTKDDFISISITPNGIVTDGTIVTFNENPVTETATATAKKYLTPWLIVDHLNIQPSFAKASGDSPFFRLDLRTNDGSTKLTQIVSFRVGGTISESDLEDDKIHLYESDSPIFNQNATFIQSKILDKNGMTFNMNRTIRTSTKYYFFTIIASDELDPDHTIFGNIVSSSDIVTDTNLEISSHGFPLNDDDDNMTLPVELSSFTATFDLTDGVGLKWITESEINVSGYHLYRNETNSYENSLRINPVIISIGIENGTQKIYTYVDDEVEINTDYYYWLECLEYDGFSDFYGPFKVYTDEDQIEDELQIDKPVTQLLSSYPNPFNPDVNIPYKLIENNSVKIDIFNVKGQRVRTFTRNNQEPGNYSIYFDGRDTKGNRLSSGIYFYRMKTDTYSQTNKMILLK